MLDFADLDARGYRTVDVRTGYGGWAGTYEDTVDDALDLVLLDALRAPPWPGLRRAADLGCGTGRTAAWLRRRGVAAVDGVDATPEMLALARERGAHDRLVEDDARRSSLAAGAYDLVICGLVDEHLPDVAPLYREAARLAAPRGWLVLVGLHPHFIIASGMPTHYRAADGEPVAIATHVHLVSDHVGAGLAAGWELAEMREAVVDDAWVERKPRWAAHRGHPVSVAYAWRRAAEHGAP